MATRYLKASLQADPPDDTEELYLDTGTTTGVQTTIVASITPTNTKSVTVTSVLTGRRTDAGGTGEVCSYTLIGSFSVIAGVVLQIGATTQPHAAESAALAGNDGTMDTDGTVIRVNAVGTLAGSVLSWTARTTVSYA